MTEATRPATSRAYRAVLVPTRGKRVRAVNVAGHRTG